MLMFMRRHIIAPILLLGTVIIGALYAPAATAVSKDDIINDVKRESAIATLCGHGAFLRSPDVGSSYSIEDFFSSAGDLSGMVEVAGAISVLAGKSEGSLREFMLGLGYTWDSAQSRHVPPRADVFCNNLVTKYNSGRKPDANSPKVRWGRTISALSDTCQLQRLGTVASLRGSQDHKIELAKTNGEDRDGWTYAIMKDVSDDGSSIVDTVVMVDLKDSVSYDTICVQFTKEASSNVTAVLEEIQAGASKTRAEVIANELCAPLKDTNPNDYNNCINETRKKAAPCFQPNGNDVGKIVACLRQSFPRDRDKITEDLIKKAIGAASATLTDGNDNSGGGGEDDGPECALEGGVGWLVCPAMTLIAGLSDGAYGLISMMLDIEPMLLNTDARKDEGVATYTAWGVFRNMANVAFIIIFLIVIFSQVSNVGISNYGIKRIMPRLIIGAILINASFFISQLAVDLSNIAGSSLKELLEVAGGGAIRNTPPPSAAAIAGGILSGTLTVGVAILAGVAIGLPGLMLFLAGTAITLLVLIGRQAGVVLLVAISPLAFASWILPNTEQWFKKWQKMLLGLLLVYPTVALLFGAGKFASKVLGGSANADWTMKVSALIVSALPLIMTPSLLRKSMDALGSISSVAERFNKRASDKISNSGYVKHREKLQARKRAQIQSGTYEGKGGRLNPSNWRTGINRWRNRNSTFNAITGGYGDKLSVLGASVAAAQDKEEMEAAEASISALGPIGNGAMLNMIKTGQHNGRNLTEQQRRAAIRLLAPKLSGKEADQLATMTSDAGWTYSMRKEAAAAVRGAGDKAPWLKGKSLADIESGGYSSEASMTSYLTKSIKAGDIPAMDADSLQRLREHAGGQAKAGNSRLLDSLNATKQEYMDSQALLGSITPAHRAELEQIPSSDNPAPAVKPASSTSGKSVPPSQSSNSGPGPSHQNGNQGSPGSP